LGDHKKFITYTGAKRSGAKEGGEGKNSNEYSEAKCGVDVSSEQVVRLKRNLQNQENTGTKTFTFN